MSARDPTGTPLPICLTTEDARRLTTDGGIDMAARARIALGLSGLTANEVHALDLRHVSMNGTDALSIIVVTNVDARRLDFGPTRPHPITEEARFLLGCHVSGRRNRCSHHRVLMRTWTDSKGVARCINCDEALDFMSLALFDSRESDRMSVSAIREDFRRIRDQLGLDHGLTFDSLREVHRAHVGGGGPGKRAA